MSDGMSPIERAVMLHEQQRIRAMWEAENDRQNPPSNAGRPFDIDKFLDSLPAERWDELEEEGRVSRAKQSNRHAIRRARVKASPKIEQIDRLTIWDRDQGICHICRQPADRDDFHLDHVIPLARGGHHTYANVKVSHPACNVAKGARL